MDRDSPSPDNRPFARPYQDGDGREDGDPPKSRESIWRSSSRGGTSRDGEDPMAYWEESRRDRSGGFAGRPGSGGIGGGGRTMISSDDRSREFASPTQATTISMEPYPESTSQPFRSYHHPPKVSGEYATLSTSTLASQRYARPERLPTRLRTFPSSTSTTSSSQPAPSSPTSPFPSSTQSPESGRWFQTPSDRHGPLPPLTLMNPLRRQSVDGFNYASIGQVPLPTAASPQFEQSHRQTSPPPIHQSSSFLRPSGSFLPPNPAASLPYNQSQRHGDASGMFPFEPPVVQYAASRTAEPGPGPRSASSLRRGSSDTAQSMGGFNSGPRRVDGYDRQDKQSRTQADRGEDAPSRAREETGIISLGPLGQEGWQLSVVQQPERARLCSFKEENETIDRRPVDPPPVVRLTRSGYSVEEMAVASVRLRAIVVSATATATRSLSNDPDPHDYEERKLAQGADATTGETTQGLDQLQDLRNEMGVFAVFGKLSVRVPGVFRLRFELYDTISGEARGLAACVSEPFEVFSPKQFKGMKESTALTRHFASQGFKIKLRQDGGAGRGGRKRKAADGNNVVDGDRRSTARPRKWADDGAGPSGTGPNDGDPLDGARMQKMRIEPVQSKRPTSTSGPGGGRQDGVDDYMDGYMDGTGEDGGATYDGELSRPVSRADGKVSLPPIGKVLKQSSIWSTDPGPPAEEVPARADGDEDVRLVGGVAFEDGIRYGGDDGGLPPMSFGRLPSMISEGILPTTPGSFLGPSDPANFSLKGLGSRFVAPVNSHNSNPSAPYADHQYDRLDGAGFRPSGLAGRPARNPFETHPPTSMHPLTHGYDDRQAFNSAVPTKAFNLAIPMTRKLDDDREGPPPPFRAGPGG